MNSILYILLPLVYQGFGIPILEAFFAHCPTIISNIEVFREIAQDCALYFDPNNHQELANHIEKLINNPQLRESLISLADKRLEHFSWEKTYSQTLNFYQELMAQKSTNRNRK